MTRVFTTICLLAATGLLSGCTGNPFKSSSLSSDELTNAAIADKGDGVKAPMYRVTLFATRAKPVPRDLVYSSGLTLNDAVERSGARDQFGRMKLDLIRNGEDGARHKMKVKISKRSGRIEPLYDYAIRPGDHIMITEDSTTELGRMLDEINLF